MDYICPMALKKKEPSGKRKNKISETGGGAISIGTDTDIHFFYMPHINLFQYFVIIEDGKQMPPIMCMYYMQKAFQLDLNWLLTGVPMFVKPDKFMGGQPPILLKKYCKERGVPVKDQYEELLKLLQVPGVAQLIFAKLTECKHIFKDEIENHIKQGKIKQVTG